MERIGQTKSIYMPTKTEVWGTFTATQKINLATQSAPCVMDPSYSYTKCIFEFVASDAGCHLDWVNLMAENNFNTSPDHSFCATKSQVLRYQTTLTKVR